ncbi:MAG: hypothetical protein LBQ21_05145 [Clostridiales Family XIII bacterium]|jgi:hypothetical protein|nr:hypothetical protein [Clostridiales Family XIII bacterium]
MSKRYFIFREIVLSIMLMSAIGPGKRMVGQTPPSPGAQNGRPAAQSAAGKIGPGRNLYSTGTGTGVPPGTGQKPTNKNNKKNRLPVIIGSAAAAVVVCVLIIIGVSGGFSSKDAGGDTPVSSEEITQAGEIEETYEEPALETEPESSVGDNESVFTGDFVIEGKWKSVGDVGVGQAQPGAIIQFTGTECNLYSPRDTYAFYKEGDGYRVDATGLLGGTLSCKVVIVDKDNIELHTGSSVTLLRRVAEQPATPTGSTEVPANGNMPQWDTNQPSTSGDVNKHDREGSGPYVDDYPSD